MLTKIRECDQCDKQKDKKTKNWLRVTLASDDESITIDCCSLVCAKKYMTRFVDKFIESRREDE